MTSKRFIHPGSRLMILVLSACLLCSCGAPWETAGNPADSADEPTDSTQDPADSTRDPADGNSGIAAGEYHFLERRKGVRQYGTLFDEDGHWLDEMAVATGASYITYTCRGHSDTDVWIVFWK